MIPEAYRVLVLNLHRKSKSGKVLWKHASNTFPDVSPDSEDFVVVTPNATINIYTRLDPYDNVGYCLDFYNSSGAKVIEIYENIGDTDFGVLQEIFEAARKKVFGIDEFIESLNKEILEDNVLGDDELPF
jgi:hypothetical protein